MKDRFERIANICLDIGIIALIFISLFWNGPAFKTHESAADPQPQMPGAAQPQWSDVE